MTDQGFEDGGGAPSGGGGLKIGKLKLPTWALMVGAGGIVLMLLLGNKGEQGQEDGLLAAELDQRLREQWEAWLSWVNEFKGDNQGPVGGTGTSYYNSPYGPGFDIVPLSTQADTPAAAVPKGEDYSRGYINRLW